MRGLDWVRDGSGFDWPRLLLAGLAIAVLGALLVAGATSAASFGPYNPGWDGSADLREDVESDPTTDGRLIRETSRYDATDPNETVAIVAAPTEEYTGDDVARVRQFVEDGGTLVVLENFAVPGNDLLRSVGAEARADGALLRDEQEYHRGPTMPIATNVADHPLSAGVNRLTLNHASGVEPGNATVLVETSEVAYRDADRDGQLGDDEEIGTIPVATVEPVGDGQVVAVGDPSIAVNTMYGEPDNAAFLQGLYADADHVLLDHSHTGEVPPLIGAMLTLRAQPALQVLVGGLGLGAIAALSRRRTTVGLGRLRGAMPARVAGPAPTEERADASDVTTDDDHRAAVIRQQHPEWDEQRVQRVIAALNRRDSERQDE